MPADGEPDSMKKAQELRDNTKRSVPFEFTNYTPAKVCENVIKQKT